MPVKHLQVPRYVSFYHYFDLNGETGWYRGMNSSLYFSVKGFFYALKYHIHSHE